MSTVWVTPIKAFVLGFRRYPVGEAVEIPAAFAEALREQGFVAKEEAEAPKAEPVAVEEPAPAAPQVEEAASPAAEPPSKQPRGWARHRKVVEEVAPATSSDD
jgi:hypothetical protein